jgi:uracil-DNA glycosylase
MAATSPQLEPSWFEVLENEFKKDYFIALRSFLVKEKAVGQVFPPGPLMFSAFNRTPFPRVKVVILGQDPYHGPGQAEGLSFSVPIGVPIPPSLKNIYKELQEDLGIPPKSHGHLGGWAQQGVLLLNSVLSVRAHSAGSHRDLGWEKFTDVAILALNAQRERIVFMLWGNYAKAKASLIDPERHLILDAAHPSPLSAYQGFLGCRHFSQANQYMEDFGISQVNWAL